MFFYDSNGSKLLAQQARPAQWHVTVACELSLQAADDKIAAHEQSASCLNG